MFRCGPLLRSLFWLKSFCLEALKISSYSYSLVPRQAHNQDNVKKILNNLRPQKCSPFVWSNLYPEFFFCASFSVLSFFPFLGGRGRWGGGGSFFIFFSS